MLGSDKNLFLGANHPQYVNFKLFAFGRPALGFVKTVHKGLFRLKSVKLFCFLGLALNNLTVSLMF